MVHVLIVEDERNTAEMLRELIETREDYLVVRTCDSIEATVSYLEKHQTKLDLIFMDIQLADGESFGIFEEIEVKVPVVFCTAYDEHIMKAFKSNGIDYLLKPVRGSDVDAALRKFEGLRSSLSKDAPANPHSGDSKKPQMSLQRTFLVRFREKMIPVAVDQIAFVMLQDEVVYLFNFNGDKYPVFKKMEEMEQALDSQQYFRINRQMMVNREAIREIEPYFNRKVVISLPFQLPDKVIVSRLKVTPFIDWVEGR